MIRHLCFSVCLALVSAAIPLRAANRPHAGMDSQNPVVWTNNDLEKLHAPGLISIVGRIDEARPSPASAAENWPFPIPLVKNNGAWYFDTLEGKDEILFRRIGKNELAAMDACRELVDAQKQYFARPPGDLPKQFAQKLISDEGQHNGLYWHGASDEFDSPINPLIAYARQNLLTDQVGEHVPFNGYMFRILTSQGRHAPGGAKNYIVDGKMTVGFAFVAYPVEYRSSGVMTFIVDKSGTIYEKDLGPNTTKIAQAMTVYDPDSTWHKVE